MTDSFFKLDRGGVSGASGVAVAKLNGLSHQYILDSALSKRLAYDGNNNVEYVGLALPGTADTAAGWQISKLTWSLVGAEQKVTAVNWANSSDAFTNVWNDRGSYSYG